MELEAGEAGIDRGRQSSIGLQANIVAGIDRYRQNIRFRGRYRGRHRQSQAKQ